MSSSKPSRPDVDGDVIIGASSPRRLDALTGVRAVAAGWVVLYHLRPQIELALPATKHLDPLFRSGYLGVDLFFVLSGFILSYSYLDRFAAGVKRNTYLGFLRLRLARIYPLQLFTLNIELALLICATLAGLTFEHSNSGSFTFQSYVANLLLVQIWFTKQLSWNGPAWSVSAEWFAYLWFPLIAVGIARTRSKAVNIIGAAAAYAVLIVCFSTFLTKHESAANGALIRVSCEFIAGCFLYRLFTELESSKLAGYLSIPTAMFVLVLPWLVDTTVYSNGIVWAPVFGILIFSLAYGVGPLARAFATRPAIFWGTASFALYMTHNIVIQVTNKAIPSSAWTGSHAVSVLALAVTLTMIAAAAVATFKLVEEPSRARLRAPKAKPKRDQAPR